VDTAYEIIVHGYGAADANIKSGSDYHSNAWQMVLSCVKNAAGTITGLTEITGIQLHQSATLIAVPSSVVVVPDAPNPDAGIAIVFSNPNISPVGQTKVRMVYAVVARAF
jgi:hypothetical protein